MTFGAAGGAAGGVPVSRISNIYKIKVFWFIFNLWKKYFLKDMGQFGNLGNMMSMFNNPQFMNMATQLMSDPQMQNV